MRLQYSVVLFVASAVALDKDDVVKIDCDSGHVDPSLAGSVLGTTDATCKQVCKTHCSNVNLEAQLDGCLSRNDLDVCLFELSRVHSVDSDHCMSLDGSTLVFSLSAEDILKIGNSGKDVEAVSMVAELRQGTNAAGCSNHAISLGVSTQPYYDHDNRCDWAGTPLYSQTFSVQDRYVITNITQLLTGAYQSGRPLTIFATFLDTSCGRALAIRDVDVTFSMRYKDGFRPSAHCQEQRNCQDCEAKGCTWCDWSQAVNVLLPNWLPDWDWIEDAREDGRGMCGVNSAVCGLTVGRINQCAAVTHLPLMMLSALLTATALI